jgi:hypothetical protein
VNELKKLIFNVTVLFVILLGLGLVLRIAAALLGGV